MTTPNLPNGTLGPGYSYNNYESNYRGPGPAPSHSTRFNNSSRNTFISCHPNPQLRNIQNFQKEHAPSVSNYAGITSENIVSSAASGFTDYPAFNSIFQTLLRGSVCPNQTLPIPPANVSGYINTVASQPPISLYNSNTSNTNHNNSNQRPTHVNSSSGLLVSNEQQTGRMTASSNSGNFKSIDANQLVVAPLIVSPDVIEQLFCTMNSELSDKDKQSGKPRLKWLNYLHWATANTRNFDKERITIWPRFQPDRVSLLRMGSIVSPQGLLGIYSESPFLRPVLLLRPVQFAVPGAINPNIPDPDNMVRTLRELADGKVFQYPGFAPNIPLSAASVGFATDFMMYVFTVELERPVVKLLTEQLRLANRTPGGPEWRIVLRFGWATNDFYVPEPSAKSKVRRALILESLPRCLSIRVAGKTVSLPDPIFHGGQAQRLGKRLRLSVDITDKVPVKQNTPVRNRLFTVDFTWLHAPLEDQSVDLLDPVATGQISPLQCHLVGLPVVQVTLDRAHTVSELRDTFRLDKPGALNTFKIDYRCIGLDSLPCDTGPFEADSVFGCYDNCIPPERSISAESTKAVLKSRFKSSNDADLITMDGDVEAADYIPICLLCPLTRTRIELAVRSVECTHIQCFDLHSYLTINYRRPRWTCPICSNNTPFRDLRRDELFMNILNDPRCQNAEFVRLDANGDWSLDTADGSDLPSNTECDKKPSIDSHPPSSPAMKRDVSTPGSTSDITLPDSPSNAASSVDLKPITNQELLTSNFHDVSNEPEIIVLSDDEEDDKEEEAEEQEKAGKTQPQKSSVSKESHSTKQVSSSNHTIANNAHSDHLSIDLTVDDSDSSGSVPLNHETTTTRHSFGSPNNRDYGLGSSRPVIVISPLPPLSTSNSGSGSVLLNKNSLINNTNTTTTTTSNRKRMRSGSNKFNNDFSEADSWPEGIFKDVMLATSRYGSDEQPNIYQCLLERVSQRIFDQTASELHKSKRKSVVPRRHLMDTGPSESSRQSKRKQNSPSNISSSSEEITTRPEPRSNPVRRMRRAPVLESESNSEDSNSLEGRGSEFVGSNQTSHSSHRRPDLVRNAPMVKEHQALALARLVQQRTCRSIAPHPEANSSSRTVRSSGSTKEWNSWNPAEVIPTSSNSAPSTSARPKAGPSGSRGAGSSRTAVPAARRRRRRRISNASDDSELDDNDLDSLPHAPSTSKVPISNKSPRSSSSGSEDEDEESDDSASSDDLWSPSLAASRSKARRRVARR